MPSFYSIFHLNLAFSSIPTEDHRKVIDQCYTPLLKLIEQCGLPLGIELTGWTLERIHSVAPEWVTRFKALLVAKKCELIGSGYTQMIGPLVPAIVNDWNQRLGLDRYSSLLGIRPTVALVNEMAFSKGLVEIYKRHGFEGIIIDWDNARLVLRSPKYQNTRPTHVKGNGEHSIAVLWAESVMFQRFQRVIHDEISEQDYFDYLESKSHNQVWSLPIYSGDAEIFDFRPGRFHEEPKHSEGSEWSKIERIFNVISQRGEFVLPSAALKQALTRCDRDCADITNAANPVSVKKQGKYNICRWALTGRDSMALNTQCLKVLRKLESSPWFSSEEHWARLCHFWASDFRTHITAERWEKMHIELQQFSEALDVNPRASNQADRVAIELGKLAIHGYHCELRDHNKVLEIETSFVRLSLNCRRGLTVLSCGFASQDFMPLFGTIQQGVLDDIRVGVDWYTDGVTIELPLERRRVTDLIPVTPSFHLTSEGLLTISCKVGAKNCQIIRSIILNNKEERVTFRTELEPNDRQLGSVRVGHICLLPSVLSKGLKYSTANGGWQEEVFSIQESFFHGDAISSMVSCRTGLGATNGRLRIGDANHAICLSWKPEECAAIPLLHYFECGDLALTRVLFSLVELDDTSKPGGKIPPFEFSVSPGEKFPQKGNL